MSVYYPRWALHISIPVAGTSSQKKTDEDKPGVVSWIMPLRRFRYERNDHTAADVLSCLADWSFAGLDPRMITDGTCEFFFGNATDGGHWEPTRADLRFCGIMQRAKRALGQGNGMSVDLLFHDYTSLFLQEKPFVSAGRPDYSQTLSQAWARICDHVGPTDENGEIQSVVKALRNVAMGTGAGLVFEGNAQDVVIGKAVAQRFAGDPIGKEITDAWATWQQVCGIHGFITFFRLDQCIVTTATNYYTDGASSPRLIYGRNLLELDEDRDVRRSRQGIVLTCFDPMTASTIEAFWPPVGDTSVRKKHLAAKRVGDADATLAAENRAVYEVEGITDVGALTDAAQGVYEQRSRQELEGHARTHEIFVPRADGLNFDIANLGAGEGIRIEIEQEMMRTILGVEGDEARVNRLLDYGYVEDVARVLVANLATFSKLSPQFLTKNVVVEAETSAEGGRYQVDVHYCNRINIDGSAD